jgi:hypothetical protein
MLEVKWEEEDEEPPGVGGNRRRDGEIGESMGLVDLSVIEAIGYKVDESPGLGGTGGGLRVLAVEGGAVSFELSSA